MGVRTRSVGSCTQAAEAMRGRRFLYEVVKLYANGAD